MIIPGYIEGEDKKPQVKLSWLVLLLNTFIFVFLSWTFSVWPSQSISEKMSDTNFRFTVAQMYKQTLDPIESAQSVMTDDQFFTAALRDAYF